MASRFTERRLVDVDAADEDEVELDDELDESGGDVLVEGVWNSPYIRRISALFSSINLSIGSLNRFVVRTREKQQQVPNKIIAFFVRDMPPTKECSFKGNNSVLISPLEDNRERQFATAICFSIRPNYVIEQRASVEENSDRKSASALIESGGFDRSDTADHLDPLRQLSQAYSLDIGNENFRVHDDGETDTGQPTVTCFSSAK